MMASLLVTRLHIPRLRAETIRRPRLLERLAAGRGRKLTLLLAPPGVRKITPALMQAPSTTITPPAMESTLTTLINGMAETAERAIVVLDDYHLIVEQRIRDALFWFLDHLPASVHLLFSTRADPLWPMARLRAQRLLNELRAEGLRFTLEEAATLLNGVIGLQLSAEDIATVDARTEGWIAGLQMAAISMQASKDVPAGGAHGRRHRPL